VGSSFSRIQTAIVIARVMALVSRCRHVQYPAHGSRRIRESRAGTVSTVNASGLIRAWRPDQASGIDTGAWGFARIEKAAMDVFVRLFRR
jgi:hypothetical protein